MKKVTVENIGPIAKIELPIPEDGGFVVLKGTSGLGKSTTIEALDTLLRGNGTLDKRDGATEGRVNGFGATIAVKKVSRRTGAALEVESLAGRLSLVDLVDPKIKDPEAADAHRIKALVQLAGVQSAPSLFYDLFGGEIEYKRIVGEQKVADLVTLAAKVKSAAEKAAREAEQQAEKEAANAAAHKATAAGFDGVQLVDPAELQADLEEAIRDESRLKAEARAAAEKIAAAEEGRKALAAAAEGYGGLTVEKADAILSDAANAFRAARDEENRLRELLAEACEKSKAAAAECNRCSYAKEYAVQHEKDIAAWKSQVEAASNVAVPSAEELATAADAVTICRQAIEGQALARKAKESEQAAANAEAKAKSFANRGENLRKAAADTDRILSEAVGRLKCPLRVHNGRLVLKTDRAPQEFFADLSAGERWRETIGLAAPLLPPGGLLTMPQDAFGELPPAVKQSLNAELKARGVTCVTAEVTDDAELYAEQMDSTNGSLADSSVGASLTSAVESL